VTDLVEDALRMNAGALERHGVRIVREYSDLPPALVDKHKLLQIIINLVGNAKYALDDGPGSEKIMTLRIGSDGNGMVESPSSITAWASPRRTSPGFLAMASPPARRATASVSTMARWRPRKMGGSLTVHSDGPGTGADIHR